MDDGTGKYKKKKQGIYSGLISNTLISPTSAAKAAILPD